MIHFFSKKIFNFLFIILIFQNSLSANVQLKLNDLEKKLTKLKTQLNSLTTKLNNMTTSLTSPKKIVHPHLDESFFKQSKNIDTFHKALKNNALLKASVETDRILTLSDLRKFLAILDTNDSNAAALLSIANNASNASWITIIQQLKRSTASADNIEYVTALKNNINPPPKNSAKAAYDKYKNDLQISRDKLKQKLTDLEDLAIQHAITPIKKAHSVRLVDPALTETIFQSQNNAARFIAAIESTKPINTLENNFNDILTGILSGLYSKNKDFWAYEHQKSPSNTKKEKLWLEALRMINKELPLRLWFIRKIRELIDSNFTLDSWNECVQAVEPAKKFEW